MECGLPAGTRVSRDIVDGETVGPVAVEDEVDLRDARPIHANPPSPDPSATSSRSANVSGSYSQSAGDPSASSDSTPSTSLMPTPEQAPAQGLSTLTGDGYPLPGTPNASVLPTTNHVKLNALTSESLLPLDRDGSSSSRSAPSVASSSEAHDMLGPLPVARPAAAERPSLSRSQLTLARQSSQTRIPLPSPPTMGLSELLSGTSLTPGTEQSYFASHGSDSASLSRSLSGSRRTPQYSPFRSYYGDVNRSDPPQPDRASISVHTDSRPIPRPISASSKARSDTASSYNYSQGKRSPHIQNNDGVLAPHGSFTTVVRSHVKDPKTTASSNVATSDSQLYLGGSRKAVSSQGSVDEDQRKALERAAAKGDQLAMYRLGWRADTPTGQRYHLGSVEDVWGPTSPNMNSITRRSSRSSRGSISSYPSSPCHQPVPLSPRQQMESDLFSDAAGLALRATAAGNSANRFN